MVGIWSICLRLFTARLEKVWIQQKIAPKRIVIPAGMLQVVRGKSSKPPGVDQIMLYIKIDPEKGTVREHFVSKAPF